MYRYCTQYRILSRESTADIRANYECTRTHEGVMVQNVTHHITLCFVHLYTISSRENQRQIYEHTHIHTQNGRKMFSSPHDKLRCSLVQDLVMRIDDELKSKLMDYNQLKSNLGQVSLMYIHDCVCTSMHI